MLLLIAGAFLHTQAVILSEWSEAEGVEGSILFR